MTWIIIAGLVCAVVVLFTDHNLAVKRINGIEEELVTLRIHHIRAHHPAFKEREL